MSEDDPTPRRRGRRSNGGEPLANQPAASEEAGATRRRPRRRATPPPEPEQVLLEQEDELGDETAFYRFSAFLGLAAACVFAAALLVYSTTGRFNRNAIALLIVSLVLAVLYAIPRWEEIAASLSSRSARQGGSVTVTGVALIGLLIVGNWYVNRHSPQWDLTAGKRYTLSDQSQKVLKGLNQDVKITFFVSGQDDAQYTRGAQDLLRQYQRGSSHVSLQIVDANTNPAAAQNYQIRNLPEAIFESGSRKEETTGVTEQDFTSALVKLSRTQQKKVYFLEGHQERDPESADQQRGFTAVAAGLKRDNYDVQKLTLATTQKVPDDASALIVAGPTVPLLDVEQKAVADYLNGGGRVLLLLNPKQDAGLSPLLDQWHVKFDNDVVLDPQRNYNSPQLVVPVPQTGNPISTSLTLTILPGARSVSVGSGAGSDFAIAPLLKTSDAAWGQTNLDVPPSGVPGQDDIRGPLNTAVSVAKSDSTPSRSVTGQPAPTPTGQKTPKGRLVAIGSVDFASNAMAQQVPGNQDLFINSVDWLTEDEDLISIRALPAGAPPVTLTSQSRPLVFASTVIFLPLAALLIGGTIWWQRR